MNSERLIVFVKAPRLGAVKTRLAKAIGATAACDAYRVLVEELLNELSGVADLELRFTPDDASAEIAPWLRNNWQMQPQGQGSLGERLQAAFAGAFSRGAQRVAIIGSDCPSVTSHDIEAAWVGLGIHDTVIGPARDGGYWLIGLRQSQPRLFNGIAWSTASVLRETLRCAEAAGLRVKLLREQMDVDTEAEWRDFLLKNSVEK